MPVVGVHAAQQSSRMALEGEYTPSRMNAFMYQRLVARNVYVNSTSHTYTLAVLVGGHFSVFILIPAVSNEHLLDYCG